MSFRTIVGKFSDYGCSFDDPAIVSCTPSLISGDVTGNIYDHEVSANPDEPPAIVLGPFPKEPMISAQISRRLLCLRVRGRKKYNALVEFLIRPIHSDQWTHLKPVDFSVHVDRETIEIPTDIEGEQFFVGITALRGQPALTSVTLYGTSTGTFRRR